MNPSTELLAPGQTGVVQTESHAPPSVGQMLAAVIERGVSNDNVDALGKLVDLYERVEAKNAEKAFAAAFVALQSEVPNVKATKGVPSNDGTIRYHFAPYEEIMHQVAPILQKNGFTVTFSMDYRENRLIQTCTLMHVGGHSRSNTFAVRVGSGPPKASECQADGAASTYAKRFALCAALNIVIDSDTDARAEGSPVTKAQADELEHRVKMTNSNVVQFLKFAGAAKFSEIMSSRYSQLDELLRKKEQQHA